MIKAIITDFDGTLVDTFEANLRAYQKALGDINKQLTSNKYRQCFGYRFDRFMQSMAIDNERDINYIREAKMKYYPMYFNFLKLNTALVELIAGFQAMGGKTAIASTSRKENLMNVINFLKIENYFDLIFSGVDVREGKPSPEIYIKTMNALGVLPKETIIFEDSQIGIEAAKASGAYYMIVSPGQFE